MLVQDHPTPGSTKSKGGPHSSIHSNHLRPSKNLDFPTWFYENLYRISIAFFIIATAAVIFFLRNVGDTASFLCFEKQTKELEKITYPKIKWNTVLPNPDRTSPFSTFRSERWIVASVSRYPTDPLRNLARIKGWQLLAVGNSKTPSDWYLKGVIFLSLEQQSKLGFGVVSYLPYDSYVRKTVGYLFAIQHGARKILDADDRGDVIENDIGKHFDIELTGEEARQDTILQYSHENPNRTVVNPYIHYGQRSVWPRGLPLENVGEISPEDFYTEIFTGKQYIQQGISNGLPDIDSVFYFTRKSGLEKLDIRFDETAPKVALPQGVMVPLNSFNTLIHYSAFWSLMLPVSVSTMASDILRGYWAQRLLWEIGGYAVVYPPTVHRYDNIESYPFSDEKDVHVNVGRLIKFLVFWRSGRHRLFQKILDLSYAMAEEGFWTDRDVEFTSSWLQDLIAVGYQQPRLMSLELDRPRASIGHGDRREFVPRKLPSVHLGVEETGTVSYEIGNLIRWRKNFGNVVLIMFCTQPAERTALEWRLLYGRIFKTVFILSTKNDTDLAVEQASLEYAYRYMPNIFRQYTSAQGFLFLQDNTILNYWNLLQADKDRLWITDKVHESWASALPNSTTSGWFHEQSILVEKTVNLLPVHLQLKYKESAGTVGRLVICSSEVFYIPRRFVTDFIDLVGIVGDLKIHHKVAVPLFFMAMESPQNYDPVLNSMIFTYEKNSSGIYSAAAPAVRPLTVSKEEDFIKLIRVMAAGDPLLMELV